jgi:hypothetical protein
VGLPACDTTFARFIVVAGTSKCRWSPLPLGVIRRHYDANWLQ